VSLSRDSANMAI